MSEVGHDIIFLIHNTREQILLCYSCTDIYSDMRVFRMNDSGRTLKPNPRLALSCFSEQSVQTCPYALTLIEVQHPASPRSRSRALVSLVRQSNLQRNSHIPVLSIQPCTLELSRGYKALVCPDKELRRCSRSASRWSWVLPISLRTDYCFAFVNKSSKTAKAQYFLPCCEVTSVG